MSYFNTGEFDIHTKRKIPKDDIIGIVKSSFEKFDIDTDRILILSNGIYFEDMEYVGLSTDIKPVIVYLARQDIFLNGYIKWYSDEDYSNRDTDWFDAEYEIAKADGNLETITMHYSINTEFDVQVSVPKGSTQKRVLEFANRKMRDHVEMYDIASKNSVAEYYTDDAGKQVKIVT